MIFQTALLFHQDRVLTKNPPSFFFLNDFILFIYFWLCWVFSCCVGFSLWRARFLLGGFSWRARALRPRASVVRLPSSRAQAQ